MDLRSRQKLGRARATDAFHEALSNSRQSVPAMLTAYALARSILLYIVTSGPVFAWLTLGRKPALQASTVATNTASASSTRLDELNGALPGIV